MKVLDLFCGAGGVAVGLHQAWPDAEITDVDINYQPRYPFKFIQSDVFKLSFSRSQFDFIWASPPCQAYSVSTSEWRQRGHKYADLIDVTRQRLKESGAPYVIENVVSAPLVDPILLCGSMFLGLKVYRHRLFESSFSLMAPPHSPHIIKQAKMGRQPLDGEFCNPVGHFPNLAYHRDAMGINWMTKTELAQAVPPAYSRWIAQQFVQVDAEDSDAQQQNDEEARAENMRSGIY